MWKEESAVEQPDTGPTSEGMEMGMAEKVDVVGAETNGELVEEERPEKLDGKEEGGSAVSEVKLGPKTFGSSVEMFDYFFKILHFWPPNLNINKYEQTVLSDLLIKGHTEADKKIGAGIKSFQVRYHPMWRNICFFLIREDGSFDDFSFRKCIDRILPLPQNMKGRSEVSKALGGRGGNGYRGRGRGRR